MNQHPYLLASILSLVMACGAESSQDSTSSEAQLTSGTVCAPLDYNHTKTPQEFYRQFDSDAKAGEYIQKLIAQGRLAVTSGPNASFQEITQDPRLVGLVTDVFHGFLQAFPRETAGMTAPPRIAIVKTDVVNAYAIGPGFAEDASAPNDQAPWIFIVHTAALEHGGSDDELRGLFAHELGHLILRTFLPEIRQRVRAIYLTGKTEDGILGAAQNDDPAVATHVEQILKRKDRVGGLPELGLNVLQGPHLPPPGTYLNLINTLMRQVETGAAHPEEVCKIAKQKIPELETAQTALLPHRPEGNYVPRTPTTDEKAHLDQLVTAIEADLRACIPGDGSLAELTALTNNLPHTAVDPADPQHATLLALMLDAEKKVDTDFPTASLIDRILRAEAALQSELVSLKNDPAFPIDRLRIFDFEEDADDASARVLSTIGHDPTSIGKFILSVGMPAAASREACMRAVAAHEPIPYGQFIDPHPAMCWRYYHATQFARALGQCTPVTPGTTTAAKGSGRASVIDKAPSEMVEKGYGTGR